MNKGGKISDVTIGYCLSKRLALGAYHVERYVIQHPKANTEHIDKVLDSENFWLRVDAMKHPNVTIANIDKALDDPHYTVRLTAIKHPKATAAHIDKASKDSVHVVRENALIIKKERNL